MSGPRLGRRGKAERHPVLFEIHDREGKVALPAMYVLINPQKFSMRASQNINRYPTRGAWVEESYGLNLDEFSANNSTAAFVSDCGLVSPSPKPGSDIPETEAYQAYEALVAVYRNNGEAHFTDGQVVRLGSVWLVYDGGVYQGYFTTFSTKEDAEKPFVFTFDFTFKVARTILTVTPLTQGVLGPTATESSLA